MHRDLNVGVLKSLLESNGGEEGVHRLQKRSPAVLTLGEFLQHIAHKLKRPPVLNARDGAVVLRTQQNTRSASQWHIKRTSNLEVTLHGLSEGAIGNVCTSELGKRSAALRPEKCQRS